MLTTIANFHHSKLPALGAIVRIRGLESRGYDPRRRWQVESYPLCDNPPYRGHYYSLGIHTVNLRSLDGRATCRVSGFWCVDEYGE